MIADRPIEKLAQDIRTGALTARQAVQECLDNIEQAKDYHAVLETSPQALSRADEVDAKIQAGEEVGRLAGVPFIAKDNFLTFHTKTTASSNMLKNYQAVYQSTAVERLEAQGAIMVAKANLDAFAHGSSTENSDFGPTKNPFDNIRVPGGSSGGSAAAVALGLCSFALGTDTGGSIRMPAAFCGVVGLKPTYGLVSRYGVVAMGSSVDCIGPLTRSVADAALVLDVMAGKDNFDATMVAREERYAAHPESISGKRIGVIRELMGEGVQPGIKDKVSGVIQKLKDAGGVVEEVSIPQVKYGLGVYYILIPAEVSSNLARYDGIRFGYMTGSDQTIQETYLKSRDEGFGDEAKRRIMIGTYVLSSGYYDAYYARAQKVRTLLVQAFAEQFEKYDALISPTTPMLPFKLGERTSDPLEMYLTDIATVSANLIGAPAISIPAGEAEGLPVGLQIITPQQTENKLLGMAAAVEELLQ